MNSINTSNNTCIRALRDEERTELLASARSLNFKAGELVVKKGTSVNDLYLLQKGTVELLMDEQRPRQSLMLLFQGEIIGVNCAYSTMNYRFSARALTDCVVLIINYHTFSAYLKQNTEFSMAFIRYISLVNERFLDWHMKLSQKNSAGALAFLLCEFEKSYGQSSFELPLNRSDIARVIGFSKESVLKNLAHFRNEGIVESTGKKVKILDSSRLLDISNYG
ncbi:Crp/Fnr family transcriptional regulator [Maribellus luteus]|uniref:Crp/Fnr family transcriptional regulator n=1 Tax=Maribellus luteus TaxID=2305463 RepID=A0A399SXD1_9BACT|nr:Crp/Fnr family transcriptional regulator [Maribellus luteus]RIJ46811.1 Crp/Fnr family transcriptional regulator [Maribellus luteus]